MPTCTYILKKDHGQQLTGKTTREIGFPFKIQLRKKIGCPKKGPNSLRKSERHRASGDARHGL